jgi:hypothetical protein
MHPGPNNVAEGEESGGDRDPMGLASFEHRLCPILVERDGRNNGASLFGRNLGEGLSADLLVLVRAEIDSGDGAAETTGVLGHAFFNGTREDVRRDGLGAPAFGPFVVEDVFEIVDGARTFQKGEEVVSELMEGHSIPEVMGRADEQIEFGLWLIIVE